MKDSSHRLYLTAISYCLRHTITTLNFSNNCSNVHHSVLSAQVRTTDTSCESHFNFAHFQPQEQKWIKNIQKITVSKPSRTQLSTRLTLKTMPWSTQAQS